MRLGATHLHHLEIKAKGKSKAVKIGIHEFDGISEEDVYPGWEISVDSYFNDLGVEAEYLYDYGDSWRHRVRLEGYMARDKGEKYPRCVEGARACPSEDCGGEPGYARLVEGLANPKHIELKGTLEFHDPYKRWSKAFLEQ